MTVQYCFQIDMLLNLPQFGLVSKSNKVTINLAQYVQFLFKSGSQEIILSFYLRYSKGNNIVYIMKQYVFKVQYIFDYSPDTTNCTLV